MSKTSLVKIPKLKVGDDKAVAEMLIKKHEQANEATKIIFDAGLLCYFIKANLKHGEFGPWLQAHTPEKMWRISDNTGKPVASSTLSWQMGFTRGLVEKCKTTIGKLLSQIPKSWEFAHRGEFLQLAAGSKLLLEAPEQTVHVHTLGSEIVEGKTAYQLFWEFKQGDEQAEDEDGAITKSKAGRRIGHGGATAAQRAAAKLREEQERNDKLKADMLDWAKSLDEHGHDKGFGKFRGSKEWKRLKESATALVAYMTRADEKGEQQ